MASRAPRAASSRTGRRSDPLSGSAQWLQDDDPRTLAGRVSRVLGVVQARTGDSCPRCGLVLCGHHVVYSIATGFEDRPLCLACMARELDRDAEVLRDELAAFVAAKECLSYGFRLASAREGCAAGRPPACLWPGGEGPRVPEVSPSGTERPGPGPGTPDARWDAGDLGCGELVLELRIRIGRMQPGQVLELIARDPGAPADLPAWCGLTGHELVENDHPRYLIRRRE